MSRLAIDVAILPPDEIMDLAVKLNQELLKRVESDLVLNKENCLPHITVAMGIVDESNLKEVFDKVEKISSSFLPLELIIDAAETYERPNKPPMSGLRIAKIQVLQSLHESVIKELKPLFSYDAKVEHFYQPPIMTKLGEYWLAGTPYKKILENYEPHLTLGHGTGLSLETPIKFTASRLAVCHLGKNSTCRKILTEWK